MVAAEHRLLAEHVEQQRRYLDPEIRFLREADDGIRDARSCGFDGVADNLDLDALDAGRQPRVAEVVHQIADVENDLQRLAVG